MLPPRLASFAAHRLRPVTALTVIGLTLTALTAYSSEPTTPPRPKRAYAATRLPADGTIGAPIIDGHLDDPAWQQLGTWAGDYTQHSPHHGAAPSRATELKILFNDRNLYVALRAHDVPPNQRSRQAGNRDDFVGDIMGIDFDSYHDQRTGFEFNLTASGQKIDLRLANNGWDTTWNAVWEGKIAHGPDSWTAEFLIPLSQLRFDPANDTWGLHAWRWIDRFQEESNWNLLPNDGSGFVKSFGELHGLTGLRRTRRLELTPYTSLRFEQSAHQPTRTDFNAGLDLKYGLTPNITLDASVLPDFGQIEADPAVMNLTAFETFLTEKRPLFLEGKDIFDFEFAGDSLFYSRRIGQPPAYYPNHLAGPYPESTTLLGALKLSGKTNQGFAFGALAAVTDSESVRTNDGTPTAPASIEVAPRAAQIVLRAQQDFRDGDTVLGGIITHVRRDITTDPLAAQIPDQATVIGTDFSHYWADREYRLKVTAVGSNVRGDPRSIARLQLNSARYFQRPIDGPTHFDPSRDHLTGTGLAFGIGKTSKGHWRWNEDLNFKDRELELNDLGYLAEADRLTQQTSVNYVVKEPGAWYRQFNVSLNQSSTWTTRHEHLASEVGLEGNLDFTNKWSVGGNLSAHPNGADPTALRGGPLLYLPRYYASSVWAGTDESKKISAKIYADHTAASEATFSSTSYGASVSARPWPTVLLRLSTDVDNRSDRQRFLETTPLSSAPTTWFVSHLRGESRSLALRVEWNLRPELSLQYYGNPFGLTLRHTETRQVLDPGASSLASRLGSALPATWTGADYLLDPNTDGTPDYTYPEPDTNYASYRSNLVLKWEYRRGSMLYLVWAQQREGAEDSKTLSAWSALNHLTDQPANNQFMLKLTYWFSS